MPGDDRLLTLAAAHRPRLLRTARRILGDENEAEDVAQDALVALLRRPDASQTIDSIRAWLDRVVTRAAIDRLRRRRRTSDEPSTVRDSAATTAAPAADVVGNEDRSRLRAAVARLPDRQRDVLSMHLQQHLSFAEIAGRLGISLGTVQTHFKRAVRTVTTELRREET